MSDTNGYDVLMAAIKNPWVIGGIFLTIFFTMGAVNAGNITVWLSAAKGVFCLK